MKRSLRFLANDRAIETQAPAGLPALDFIRGELGLTGAKEGCREGDCGACAVLVGERLASSEGGAVLVGERLASSEGGAAGRVRYRALPSCLLALGELEGRHLVTIEGLRGGRIGGLTPVMEALLAENGSQCGFCSPGFVISLTAFLLEGPPYSFEGGIRAVEGNLCRCTGYGAIKRSVARLVQQFGSLPAGFEARLSALEAAGVVPTSLGSFARGEFLPGPRSVASPDPESLVLGGGTDYYVRNPDPELDLPPRLLDLDPALRAIAEARGELELGAALSWREFFASASVRSLAPGIERFEGELASVLVRDRATLGGNVANASPIADATAMLIALGARARLGPPPASASRAEIRELPLERLFLGYKRLDLRPGEIVLSFVIPSERPLSFNFEKVAKRSRLDIASVNSAAAMALDGDRITRARLSAGGVAPVPLFLERTSAFLGGRRADAATAREASRIAVSEASPIGDVRGSAEYRGVLLARLVIAHFDRLFPGRGIAEEALA